MPDSFVHFRADQPEPKMKSFNLRRHPKHPFHAFVPHGLDNSYPLYQVWDVESGSRVKVLVQTLDSNTLVAIFQEAVPLNRYVMTVMG